jgi:hypothetical protein
VLRGVRPPTGPGADAPLARGGPAVPATDPALLLVRWLEGDDVGELDAACRWLAAFGPPHPGYCDLRRLLFEHRVERCAVLRLQPDTVRDLLNDDYPDGVWLEPEYLPVRCV